MLPIKSHQLYQEIILLKYNLIDLLPLYECNTNLNFPSSQVLSSQGAVLPQVNIDRPAPSSSISNSCPSIDIVADLIDLLIEAQQVSNRLKIIASALRSVDNIQIYTDGSLQYDVSSMATMGFGWMVVNNEAFEFSASAILWPSSTKAKMLACLSTLMVVPVNATVTLYTDSAATITGFEKLDEFRNLSARRREKILNFQLWMTVAHIIECKCLTVNMIKVKAHSGDRLNDRADKLAKEVAVSAPRLNIIYMNLPGINVELTVDNLTLETSSRKSIKTLFEAHYFSQFLNLHRNADIKLLTEFHHLNWSATSFMLNYNISANDTASTSFTQHRLRSFKYKIFSEELLTLSRMRRRRPDVYPDDVCRSCLMSTESQFHFWKCPSH